MLARWVPRLVSHACVGALLCAACDAPRPRVRDDLDASDDASTAARFARPTLDPLNRQRRARCAFEQGAVPSETLDPTDPRGDSIPIDHFIVIMQENRSFDEYFEMLPERGVPDADVAPKHFSNPDPHARGAAVSIFHQTQYCEDDVEHDADSD
ncbi:MAG TPA: alkaline phosphatase family protein, partial [Polyangiales bacterium]